MQGCHEIWKQVTFLYNLATLLHVFNGFFLYLNNSILSPILKQTIAVNHKDKRNQHTVYVSNVF